MDKEVCFTLFSIGVSAAGVSCQQLAIIINVYRVISTATR